MNTKPLIELKGHLSDVQVARFSPDGEKIVTVTIEKTPRLWDARTGKRLFTLKGHTERVRDAVFSPDSRRLLTRSDDNTLKLWDVNTGEVIKSIAHSWMISSITFSPTGAQIIAIAGSVIKRWDASGALLKTPTMGDRAVSSVSMNADESLMLVVCNKPEDTIEVWETHGWTTLATTRASDGARARFSPDGQLVVSHEIFGASAKIWEARSGKLRCELSDSRVEKFDAVTFSPDGAKLVSTAQSDGAALWDSTSGSLLATFGDGIDKATFSPDSKLIVTNGPGSTTNKDAYVWSAETGALLATLKGHETSVVCSAFSPDGAYILTAARDKFALLWRSPREGAAQSSQKVSARAPTAKPPVKKTSRVAPKAPAKKSSSQTKKPAKKSTKK